MSNSVWSVNYLPFSKGELHMNFCKFENFHLWFSFLFNQYKSLFVLSKFAVNHKRKTSQTQGQIKGFHLDFQSLRKQYHLFLHLSNLLIKNQMFQIKQELNVIPFKVLFLNELIERPEGINQLLCNSIVRKQTYVIYYNLNHTMLFQNLSLACIYHSLNKYMCKLHQQLHHVIYLWFEQNRKDDLQKFKYLVGQLLVIGICWIFLKQITFFRFHLLLPILCTECAEANLKRTIQIVK
ncbi:unnamed protein product [Paramecium octaurelia]|uniref:Transmembrane protein n=1 Tax=Paramecium octaurelia TaxID=43137 RepID=A0A8S1YRS2_PAROT|nr:unnamed protein product [Paramecium octaurelia]